jgi:predicted RNA-binding protein with TRAM domain
MYGNTTNAPVTEGEEYDVKIEAIGDKGDGIAKKDGFVLVIPGAQLNDEVRIKVTKVLSKVGFAEVVGNSEGSNESPAEDAAPVEGEEVPAEDAAPVDGKKAPAEEPKEEFTEDF